MILHIIVQNTSEKKLQKWIILQSLLKESTSRNDQMMQR